MSQQPLPLPPPPAPSSTYMYPPIPTALPDMPYSGCDTWPPPDYPAIMPYWNETVLPPAVVCATRIQGIMYPCCAQQGGEARTVCERVMCKLDNSTGVAHVVFWDCMAEMRARANDTARWSPLDCWSDVPADPPSGAVRARAALALWMLVVVVAAAV